MHVAHVPTVSPALPLVAKPAGLQPAARAGEVQTLPLFVSVRASGWLFPVGGALLGWMLAGPVGGLVGGIAGYLLSR